MASWLTMHHTLFLRPEDCRQYAHPFSRARFLLAEDDAAREAKLERNAKEAERLRCRHYFRKWFTKPRLRISLDCFTAEGDSRFAGSEGLSDEAGKDMDHGVGRGPVT